MNFGYKERRQIKYVNKYITCLRRSVFTMFTMVIHALSFASHISALLIIIYIVILN